MKKRVLIIIAALIFANANSIFAQQNSQQRPYMQIRQYINQNVVPFIKTQKEFLTSSLTDNEKEILKEIENDLATFRKQGKQIRESMKGNYNQSMADLRKKSFDKIIARADSLLANHPDAVSAYKKAYLSEKDKWEKEMANMIPYGKQKPFITKRGIISHLENPSYTLLWNGNTAFMNRDGKNMHRPAKTNMKSKALPIEIREKIRKYAETNIVPVIEKEQKEFEKTLSKKELKKIEEARKLIASRKENMPFMNFDKMSKPEVNDSLRLAMQIEMQKAILPVREIALKHYSALEQHITTIKENFPKWKEEIGNIVKTETGFNASKAKLPPFVRYKIKRLNRPEAFLMFDKSFFDNNMTKDSNR